MHGIKVIAERREEGRSALSTSFLREKKKRGRKEHDACNGNGQKRGRDGRWLGSSRQAFFKEKGKGKIITLEEGATFDNNRGKKKVRVGAKLLRIRKRV